MIESLITFETAKLAKEKGFDGYCYDAYNSHGMQYTNGWCEYIDDNEENIPFNKSVLRNNDVLAPTQSLLQKWLREAHEIFVSVDVNFNIKIYYKDELHNEISNFNSYEEALEKGLQGGLKLIE